MVKIESTSSTAPAEHHAIVALTDQKDCVDEPQNIIHTYTRKSETTSHADDPILASVSTEISVEAVQASSMCFGADQPCTGHAVWFAADNLSNLIHDQYRALLGLEHSSSVQSSPRTKSNGRPRQVLELGAGPGLAGIWMAKYLEQYDPTARVLLTDGDQEVVHLLNQNCTRNGLATTTECRQLWWGADAAKELLASSSHGPFDIILGADLVYGRNDNRIKKQQPPPPLRSSTVCKEENNAMAGTMVADLLDTVNILLAKRTDTSEPSSSAATGASVFYLGFTRRDLPIELVLEAATQRGLTWELEEDYNYDIFDTNTDGQTCFWRDAIYAFRRKDEHPPQNE